MPIYEFFCKECELPFEQLKAMGDSSAGCPICGAVSTKREVSDVATIVKGGNKRTIDHIIGEDAEQKWQKIHEDKAARDKAIFGSSSDDEIKTKDATRIDGLVKRQNEAYGTIEKAKKDAGITKNDELRHILGGSK